MDSVGMDAEGLITEVFVTHQNISLSLLVITLMIAWMVIGLFTRHQRRRDAKNIPGPKDEAEEK